MNGLMKKVKNKKLLKKNLEDNKTYGTCQRVLYIYIVYDRLCTKHEGAIK